MASLTGTKIKDTYDSLIKVSDNGALDGTLQTLTDGLGNNSALSLSTSGASVTGTLAVSGAATLSGGVSGNVAFDTNTLFVDAASNNVGVGTASPLGKLEIKQSNSLDYRGLLVVDSATPNWIGLAHTGSAGVISVLYDGAGSSTPMVFKTADTERMRIDSSGNVSISSGDLFVTGDNILDVTQGNNASYFRRNASQYIAISSDSNYHQFAFTGSKDVYFNNTTSNIMMFATNNIERMRILSSGGITFNGDNSSANALDDYEEGTFTPTFVPTSGAFDSITYSVQYGKYTKIGNRVDINIQISCSTVSLGTAGGVLTVANLPYIVGAKLCPLSIIFVANWPTNRFPIRAGANDGASNILLRYVTALNQNETYLTGTDIQAGSEMTISGTYFI